jgi:hypothetical protein
LADLYGRAGRKLQDINAAAVTADGTNNDVGSAFRLPAERAS